MKVKLALIIFAVTLALYSNVAGGEFFSDDFYFVITNTYIRTLDSIPLFFTNPATVAAGGLSKEVYRPLTPFSYAIDHFFWGLNPFGYHLTNILLHAANAVLVFLLLNLILGDIFLAVVAALLFATHPVQTEAVSWVSGRASVLSLLFYLATLIFYVKYSLRGRKAYYLASLSLCAAALFSKEMAVTLPLVIAAYDIHFTKDKLFREKLLRCVPFLALTLFYVAVRTVLLKRVGQFDWWGGGLYATALTMAGVLVDYIKLLVLPLRLCVSYLVPISRSIAEGKAFFSVLFLLVAVASLPAVFKRSKKASFAIWWFLIALLPVSNIIPLKALMAERFLYVPSIGFCLLLALAVRKIYGAGEFAVQGGISGRKAAALIIAASIIMAYSARTIARNEDWKSALTLSMKAVKVFPLNPWALSSLGGSLAEKGRYEEALKPLTKAAMLSSNYALSKSYAGPRDALANCYLSLKRYEEAIPLFKEVLAMDPGLVASRNSLAICYAELKRYGDAEREFLAAIKIDPRYMNSYFNLAKLYDLKKDFNKAIEACQMAIAVASDRRNTGEAYMWMGDFYLELKQRDKARECYSRALKEYGRGSHDRQLVVEEKLKGL